MQVRFEVVNHPEFTVEELAVQLAESLQGSMDSQNDARVYQEQIRTEKRKIVDEGALVARIQDWRSNPPSRVSRMEPMMQYNLDMMKYEIEIASTRIEEWKELIATSEAKTKQCQQDTIRLQKEIAGRNSKK